MIVFLFAALLVAVWGSLSVEYGRRGSHQAGEWGVSEGFSHDPAACACIDSGAGVYGCAETLLQVYGSVDRAVEGEQLGRDELVALRVFSRKQVREGFNGAVRAMHKEDSDTKAAQGAPFGHCFSETI